MISIASTSRSTPVPPRTPATRAVAAAPPRAGNLPRRFWTRTFFAAPVAVGITLLTRLVAGTVVPIAPGFTPLELLPIVGFTAVALHVAAAVLALCYRFSTRPVQWYRRIALAALVLSVVPDLVLLEKRTPGATPATVSLLVLLHLVAGSVGVWLLPALAVGHGGSNAAAVPGAL